METEARYEAERVLESLRSGVPSAALAQRLAIGRERLLEKAGQVLDGGLVRPLMVRASYGDGKTHFLEAVAVRARQAGWVVSTVSVSREVPLANLDKFYGAVAAATRLPDSAVSGLMPLLNKVCESGRARTNLEGVPERLSCALDAYCLDSAEHRDELLGELSGRPIGSLAKILREAFSHPVKFPPFSPSRDAIGYFRLMDRLVTWAGYRGWALLIDEVELLGKTGIGQRARAYANLAGLIHGGDHLEHTWVVAALASNYYPEVIEARQERTAAPEWLAKRARSDEAADATRGIQFLLGAELLPPLTLNEVDQLLLMVRDAHGAAYAWTPPEPAGYLNAVRHLAKSGAPVRTRIRAAVQWLDLWMQYGHAPTIEVWNPQGTSLAEELEEETPEHPQPIGVSRPAIF